MKLTPAEARLLYEWLKNTWAPTAQYAEFMAIMAKLRGKNGA